jgi:para-aminobenzoate synthetase component 1
MRQSLSYFPDLGARLRAACQPSDRAMWLRLGSADRELFSAFPVRTLLISNQSITPETESTSSIVTSWLEFWSKLPEMLKDSPNSEELNDLPFRGGLMGFLSYDTASAGSELRFPAAYMGFYPHFILIDHGKKTAELVHLSGYESDRSAWSAIIENVTRITKLSIFYKSFTLLKPFYPLTPANHYKEDFNRIKNYLQQGDCYQVNYSQAFSAPCQGSSAAAMETLLKVNDPAYAAWLSMPEGDVFCLSPELLLRNQGGHITTKPIKGTAARSKEGREADTFVGQSLQASLKNRAENLMIVDLMRNDLSKHAQIGSVRVSKLFDLESLPHVHHLVSTITARLKKDSHVIELIKDMFPGGSITGAPKKRAMEIISELEPTPRLVYCGSIGYINPDGDAQLNIAIRTLLRLGDNLYAWAGGGIVADSDFESEYQECFDKIGVLMDALEKGNE